MALRSELGRQIAVDFEADADLDQSRSGPRHGNFLLIKSSPCNGAILPESPHDHKFSFPLDARVPDFAAAAHPRVIVTPPGDELSIRFQSYRPSRCSCESPACRSSVNDASTASAAAGALSDAAGRARGATSSTLPKSTLSRPRRRATSRTTAAPTPAATVSTSVACSMW